MKPTLLILAAGLGSRYGGVKQMDKIGPSGESIIDYSIYDAIRAGFGKVVFVINKKIEQDFKDVFEPKLNGRIETIYVLQDIEKLPQGFICPKDRLKPWGTAHAILATKDVINEPFAVINADDFYGAASYATIKEFFDQSNEGKLQFSMVGYNLDKTVTDFGTVSRGVCSLNAQSNLIEVNERTNIQRKGKSIGFFTPDEKWNQLEGNEIVSMNFWGFTPDLFKHLESGFVNFLKESIDTPKSEYYIPTIVTELIANKLADFKVLESKDQWFGVTYQQDRPIVIESVKKLVESGEYPKKLWA